MHKTSWLHEKHVISDFFWCNLISVCGVAWRSVVEDMGVGLIKTLRG